MLDSITDDALTGEYRVYQRARGHRYSIDDVATAFEALSEAPNAEVTCDLGCGIGSVLLMVASKLGPDARHLGIEAQDISIELARQNVERNGLGQRIELMHGDLRTLCPTLERRFDLITGTPPYFDPTSSSPSTDSQRTHARIEMRGGIEDYIVAGARVLEQGGVLVVCGDAKRPDRALDGARRAGLCVTSERSIIPRRGKAPLFSVWTFRRLGRECQVECKPPLVLREADGSRSEDAFRLREFFGLALRRDEAPSPPMRERRSR